MDKNELIRMATEKAQETARSGNKKALLWLVGIAVVVLLGFLAYRLLMVELFTQLFRH